MDGVHWKKIKGEKRETQTQRGLIRLPKTIIHIVHERRKLSSPRRSNYPGRTHCSCTKLYETQHWSQLDIPYKLRHKLHNTITMVDANVDHGPPKKMDHLGSLNSLKCLHDTICIYIIYIFSYNLSHLLKYNNVFKNKGKQKIHWCSETQHESPTCTQKYIKKQRLCRR